MTIPLTVLPILSAFAIYFVRLAELKKKRDVIAGVISERLTLKLFMMTGTLMLLGSLVEFLIRQKIHWICFAIGWPVSLASFYLRNSAIAALGRFWSLHVEIRDKHEFVKSGPFRWVRHPTYLSMIFELLGVGLILNAFYMLAAIPFIFLPVLLMRVRIEEFALVQKFGEPYLAYQKTTPAILPYRWPIRHES